MRGFLLLQVAVCAQERTQGLAQFERSAEIFPAEPGRGRHQPLLPGPGGQRAGIGEPLAAVLEVDRVDEQLDEPERRRSGLR